MIGLHYNEISAAREQREEMVNVIRIKSMNLKCWLLGLSCLVWTPGWADEEVAAEKDFADRLFTLKVLPTFNEKCFGCHADDADDLRGEFDMRDRAGLLRGGETEEAAIIPGDAEESPLVHSIRWESNEMPPKENDRLSEEQIQAVETWIKLGAPWPSIETQQRIREEEKTKRLTDDGQIVDTSGGTSEAWTFRRYEPEDLWAWRPVRKPDLSKMSELTNPVDHFIDAELERTGLDAAGEASPSDLIRRATYDLVGLPPTAEAIERFEAAYDASPETAWSELIDRLLESPAYGERWAQHWLDVTRYADTGGMSNDYERSNLWRYRDYVIRAFNEDKPYNDFIVEQLAGDELADASVRQRLKDDDDLVWQVKLEGDYTPEEAEKIIATGFLRLGPWDNAMVKEEEARQMYLDDLVNITGQTFLSTTMRCVKCHDHKFDPIPTRDYYRMYAAFATTQMAERGVPFLDNENLARFEEGEANVRELLDFAKAKTSEILDKQETAAKKWYKEHDLPYKKPNERQSLPDDEKPPRHVGLDHVEQGRLKVREQDVWIWNRRLERYRPMAQSVYNAGNAKLAWNGARKLRIDKKADRKKSPQNHILTGGALTALGDPVGPGVLSATGLPVGASEATTASEDPFQIPEGVNGRRLALARWIAHEGNPLTARSMVNRVWQWHFGRGIAANSNNFGAKGAKPTHPELLDFLASDFMDHGWTMKRMHRLLMTSKAYRRSGFHPEREAVAQSDPNNQWLSYFPMRRLTAEEIRDSMLAITGELNPMQGGLPVKPEINMEVALQPRMIQFSLAPAYQPSRTPDERNRRSVYAYRVRGQRDPMLVLFNQADPNESCEIRDSAAVTPQVFTLLNSDMVTDRSIALATTVHEKADGIKHQVEFMFRRVLGRRASSTELSRLTQYVEDMRRYHEGIDVEPVTYPAEITRSLVEEFSGRPFDYVEILPRLANYVPDTKSDEVSPHVRALADLGLLLFNTNEWMYVK